MFFGLLAQARHIPDICALLVALFARRWLCTAERGMGVESEPLASGIGMEELDPGRSGGLVSKSTHSYNTPLIKTTHG